MTSPPTLHSQPISRPGRRSRRVGEGDELGTKPKKVNSEVRKQQNRIASRNYREKRKRKLQYLQQLIRDGSNDDQTPEASPQQHEAHLRSLSAEYDAGQSSSPYMLPTNSAFGSTDSSSTVALHPAPTISTASYDSHLLPTTQSYSPFEWNSPMYNPPPPTNMPYTPAWTPSIDYSSRLAPRPERFQFSPPLVQPAFEQASSPYHHPRELAPHANHYVLGSPYGHYNGSQNQTSSIPSVSLPTPSSYFQGHYPGPH